MPIRFEWDLEKAESNRRKHRVSFEEAATAFGDPLSLTIPDPNHSVGEDRYLLLGQTFRGRLIVVSHLERNGSVRVISARLATRREQKNYEET
jgi:hypothetical protein